MGEISIRKQFANTVLEVGQKDERLVVLLGDIGHFNMQPFAKKCQGRFYNVGICEQTIVSMGAGLSKVGFIPVMHTINPFIVERAFEQLKLDFVYQKLSGNIVTVGSLFDYSQLGCSHHCYGDFALLKTLFNVEILYPATTKEFDILFKQTYNNNKLTFFRIPEASHDIEFDCSIEVGRAVRITEGKDLTIIVTGPQLKNAKRVQETLAKENISIEILYFHSIRPLDKKSIFESVYKTKKVIVIEEHGENGGLGEDILKEIYKIDSVRFEHICIKEKFIHEYGKYDELLNLAGINYSNILNTAIQLLK